MRFLQLFNDYAQPGGETKSVERIFRVLSTRHEVVKFRVSGRDWSGPNAPGKLSQFCKTLFNSEVASQALALSRSNSCEAWIVHNAFPILSPAIYETAKRHQIPIIQFLHNFRPFSVSGTLWFQGTNHPQVLLPGGVWQEVRAGAWQNSRLKSAVLGLALDRLRRTGWLDSVKAWVGISEFIRDRFVEAGVPANRAFALRHSWDIRPEPASRVDDGSFLFLGRLVEEKGVRVLLQAWDLLSRQAKMETPKLILGGDGPLRGEVEAAASRLPSVHYVGQVDGEEKDRLIASCRAMLAPSVWWEPLGLVTYEAYEQGKPMLAAASGGLTETVLDGQTGYLHEPGNAHQLAEHVCRLNSRPDNANTMGTKGREWLKLNTSNQLWLGEWEAIVAKATPGANNE